GAGGPPPRITITPTDNPLVTSDPNAKLVFAYGFRNPFRFQIDPVTGLLYAGDVGYGTWEEYDEVRGGNNFGWPFREANESFTLPGCVEPPGTGAYRAPIAFFAHAQGQAIMG